VIPYTWGLSRYFSGAVAGERSTRLLFLLALLVYFPYLAYKSKTPKNYIMDYVMWSFRKYVESLNISLGTDFLNARNHVESAKEGDEKSLSLGMCMPPQEE
jgi:hypothetical protein